MGRRTEARNHPRLLLVEGDDDKRFVPELVELGIGDEFQWERDGGPVVFIAPQGGVEPLLAPGTIDLAERSSSESARLGAPYKPTHLDKAIVHTWLAWRDPPGRQLHDAVKQRMLDPRLPLGQAFIDWFRKLYRV